MLAWILAAWVAFAGKDGGKLPEKWCPCYRTLQSSYRYTRFLIDYECELRKHNGPYGGGRINTSPVFVSPTLQWAVPNSCLNGPPVGPYFPYVQYPNE